MGDHIVVKQLEIFGGELAIAVPPNAIFGQRVGNGVFVLRAAAGMDAGLGAEGAAVHERALAVCDRVLHQNGVEQIPTNASEVLEAEFIGAVRAVPHTRFLHPSLRFCRLSRPLFWLCWLVLSAVSWSPIWPPVWPPQSGPSGRSIYAYLPRRHGVRPYIQPSCLCQD